MRSSCSHLATFSNTIDPQFHQDKIDDVDNLRNALLPITAFQNPNVPVVIVQQTSNKSKSNGNPLLPMYRDAISLYIRATSSSYINTEPLLW